MRLYVFLSHIGLAFTLLYAFLKYGEFYASIIYLSTEKFPKMIIYNFILMTFIVVCKVLLTVFIGELRYLEVEQLVDNARAFIMDTILFLVLSKPTINGKEVSSIILIKYLSIIVILKAYHLVLYSRVSHIFELGIPRTKVLVKLFIFMCLLSIANLTLFTYFYKNSLKNSTMYLWLFFESLSIFESCQISIFKFFVNIIDLRSPNGLSSKATILFFLDMLHDIMSLIIFLVFIMVFVLNNFSNLPLHMTADVIHVVKTLISRFKSFQRYRELTKNIETKFIDATEEELKEVGTCIICRDDLKEGSKKLSCAHIFHIECLKSWFIQQQTCPICRSEIKPYSHTEQKNKNINENEKKEEKINASNLLETVNEATFITNNDFEQIHEMFSVNNQSNRKEETNNTSSSVSLVRNEKTKEQVKVLHDMCQYYKELCVICLKEIDKLNYDAVPANIMLRSIYGSLNENNSKAITTEEREIVTFLNKMSYNPQMNKMKNYLEKVLITDMKFTNDISKLVL